MPERVNEIIRTVRTVLLLRELSSLCMQSSPLCWTLNGMIPPELLEIMNKEE